MSSKMYNKLTFPKKCHRYHNSFFVIIGRADCPFVLIASLFPAGDLVVIDTIKAPIASPTRETTAAHAPLHTCMLTVPKGARGKDSTHSTCHGTHPRGSAKIGVFEYQNCKRNFRPVVLKNLTDFTARSNELLCWASALSAYDIKFQQGPDDHKDISNSLCGQGFTNFSLHIVPRLYHVFFPT